MLFERSQRINFLNYLSRKKTQTSSSPYLFAYSRTALRFGIQTLNLAPGSEILIPDFTCNVVLLPLQELGLKAKYYRITEKMEPDWENLAQQITDRTKGLLLIHFFGFAQDINKHLAFCKEHNLALIEDNANGFGSMHQGSLLGTFGDIGVISPWKSLPILNGSLLYIKKSGTYNFDLPHLMPCSPISSQISSLGGRYIKEIVPLKKMIFKHHYYDKLELLEAPGVDNWSMDSYSYKCIQKVNLKEHREIKQKLYFIWKEWAEKQGLQPVFSDEPGECAPIVFPAYAADVTERNKWFWWGFYNKIDVHSWPTLPREVRSEESNAKKIWEKMLCFPIHTKINPLKLERKLKKLTRP